MSKKEEIKKKNQIKYNTKKIIMLVIFFLAITIFVMTLLLSLNDFKSIVEVLKTTNIKYLMLAIMLVIIYLLLYPITLCILTKKKNLPISPLHTYMIGSTEHFFNGITPFATGGQPFQVYAFKQMGIKLSDSSGILVMNFVIFMMVTNLYALISLFYYPLLKANISNLNAMVIIGFGINFFVLLFMISIATSKKLRHLLENALVWLCKFKWLKKFVEPGIPAFHDYCKQTQQAFKELWGHKGTFFICFVIKFITMGVYYSITFFILRALGIGVSVELLPFIISSTAFAITMCVFIPTPGGSGGIEFAFKSIFQAITAGITTTVAMGGMLLWRSLTFFLVLFISFLMYLILQHIIVKKVRREEALADAEIDSIVDDEVIDDDNLNQNADVLDDTQNNNLSDVDSVNQDTNVIDDTQNDNLSDIDNVNQDTNVVLDDTQINNLNDVDSANQETNAVDDTQNNNLNDVDSVNQDVDDTLDK